MATGKKTGGRKKGTPNKTTALLKDAVLMAAEQTGADAKGKDGLVGYLRMQAQTNPNAFMPLVGKVLPLQVSNDPDNPIGIEVVFVNAGKD